MASLFGEMASEVGGTVKDLALQKREDRLADEEHQREVQLQKQRLKHDSDLTDRRISADDRRDTRRQDFEQSLYDLETQRRSTEAETQHGYETEITRMQEQSDIVQTILSNTLREENRRSMSGGGWSVEFGRDQQVFDPETNSFVLQPGLVRAQAPGGRPYRIIGDKAFPAGEENPQVYPFPSLEQQRQAEQALYEGKVTVEQFRDDFGYIPSDFIFGRVTRDEPETRKIIESVLGERPAWLDLEPARTGGGEGGGTKGTGQSPESRELPPKMEDDYVYPPGPEMKPSIEELSEGPARDAHIAAQGGKTNAEIAAEMRAEAGTEGGALSEAQSLEQGGQLEQPTGRSEIRQELDDNRAADIAKNIQMLMEAGAQMGGTY